MPAGNRRPLYHADEVPTVDQKPVQHSPTQPGPLPAPAVPSTSDIPFKQPCTLKGISAAFYAGALGYFLGFVPATIKFKARQWGMIHSQGLASASQLALMSGMYTTVHCICQRIRMVEDGWNRGIAGCSTGLVLGWKTGPWGALQSCASLGLLSALIDLGGGAVEAAEAAALHQLQEIQQQQQEIVPASQVIQGSSSRSNKQVSFLEQFVGFLADPCTAVTHLQQLNQHHHPLQDSVSPLHSSSTSSIVQQQQQVPQEQGLPVHSAVGQAVQQVQQLIAAPPLMFLGACCQAGINSNSSKQGGAAAGEVVDACVLTQERITAATKASSKRWR